MLTRWTWRTLLRGALIGERAVLRQGVATIKPGNAEDTALALLKLVPHTLPTELQYRLPDRFNARTAESRLAMLGLISLNPLTDPTQVPVDIPKLIAERDLEAFRAIIPISGRRTTTLVQSPANRILLPGTGSAKQELTALAYTGNEEFFASHGITSVAWHYLAQGETNKFLQERHTFLEQATRAMGDGLALWGKRDRPSIGHLLELSTTDN